MRQYFLEDAVCFFLKILPGFDKSLFSYQNFKRVLRLQPDHLLPYLFSILAPPSLHQDRPNLIVEILRVQYQPIHVKRYRSNLRRLP